MISLPDRVNALRLTDEAVIGGARRRRACAALGLGLGLDDRTYRRWRGGSGGVRADARPEAVRPPAPNRLDESERAAVLETCHAAEFASLPPGQIVPTLADRGEYLASESSFYRLLRDADEQHHRGRASAPRTRRAPTTHRATAPGQLWSWDVTFLRTAIRGEHYYLYLILDVFSRYVVGWEVYEAERGELAAELVQRTVVSENAAVLPPILHADNGSIQRGSTLRATLERLGIEPSFSRPRVSNDNACSEAWFRTAKYASSFPTDGFASLVAAREWVLGFVRWYNEEHHHSGIRYVTPAQRHRGEEKAVLANRAQLYAAAKDRHPARWSGKTRNWEPIGDVWLNPERESKAELTLA